MGPGTFWGLFLILIGFALIIKVVFHLEIPVFKILFAVFFILLGFKILFGNFKFNRFKTDGNDVIFGEIRVSGDNLTYDEYNIIFGKGEFDLRDINLDTTGTKYVKIAAVFGGCKIILNENIPVKISSESVFSGGKLPDGNSVAFGTSTYISPNYDPLNPHLIINLEMVFSSFDVKRF